MVKSQLAARGITEPRLLDAMRRVPREMFVPAGAGKRAYDDCALEIECDQTISQPYMVGRMTELLDLRPDSRVLEIGAGSGYQTAILSHLAGGVYSVEWHLKLMLLAFSRLEKLGRRNVVLRCGDGSQGWAEHAPYDAIIVTAGAPDVPSRLPAQLSIGGRLIAPVGPRDEQTLVEIRRSAGGFDRCDGIKCRFVRLRGRGGWAD